MSGTKTIVNLMNEGVEKFLLSLMKKRAIPVDILSRKE